MSPGWCVGAKKTKDAFFRREGVKLTYMPAIAEATAQALAAYPQVNVSVDGYNILYKKHINVGIAVSQDDGNLIVPVVHDADRLNLNGLAVAIDSLAKKARVNKLMPDDIDGGTFTITNFGTFKMLFGTPIINQPQVAILGVGVIEKKPAVVETPEGDVIAIRHKMYLSLSYDHRVVDGSLEVTSCTSLPTIWRTGKNSCHIGDLQNNKSVSPQISRIVAELVWGSLSLNCDHLCDLW